MIHSIDHLTIALISGSYVYIRKPDRIIGLIPNKIEIQWISILFGTDKQTPLELLDYIIYEPELSMRLLNDLRDIFSTANRDKELQLVA